LNKSIFLNNALSVFLITGFLFGSMEALAEYKVTAFSDAVGYKNLIKGGGPTAFETITGKKKGRMDFMDLNNLCVALIMSNRAPEAVKTCEMASRKLKTLKYNSGWGYRRASADVYSNLGVAKALSGDFTGASSDLEKAQRIFSRHQAIKDNIRKVSLETGSFATIGENQE